MQWLQRFATDGSDAHPMNGSVVQRLQRFATYGSLKQQVLRIITDELAIGSEQGQDALKKVLFGFFNGFFVPFSFFFSLSDMLQAWASQRCVPYFVSRGSLNQQELRPWQQRRLKRARKGALHAHTHCVAFAISTGLHAAKPRRMVEVSA